MGKQTLAEPSLDFLKIKELEAEIKQLRQQLKSQKKEAALIASSLVRHQKARAPFPIKAATPKRRQKGDIVRVIFGDSHGAKVDKIAVAALLGDIQKLEPSEIVLLGDHVDCGGFLAQHHTMGYVAETAYSYEEDIAEANSLLDSLQNASPAASIHYIEGNHECLTADHDVLTREGWVPIANVKKRMEVATLGADGATEWQKPTKIIKKDYNGALFVNKSDRRQFRVRMTPGHRVPYYGQRGGAIRYTTAEEFFSKKGTTMDIPVTGSGLPEDCGGVCDDEIRLISWILTDGCLTGGVNIYQSKKEGIEAIHEILGRLGIQYSFRVRKTRVVKPINGTPVKTSLPQGIFHIGAQSRDRVLKLMEVPRWNHYGKYKKAIPSLIHRLSHRQFSVFLESIIAGDGHPTSDKAATIYGDKNFLEEIQRLCAVNGVKATLAHKAARNQHNGHWALYTVRAKKLRAISAQLEKISFQGLVYCLSTPNTNFFVRHKGAVHITGNCRIERWATTQTLRHQRDSEMLRKAFAPEYLLRLKERGIPYYRMCEFYHGLSVPGFIRFGKCYFTHGFSAARHTAAATIAKVGGNVVFGHSHRSQSFPVRPVATGEITAWNPGCLTTLQPLWNHTNPNDWTHGYAVQLVAPSGNFLHLNIPIINGESLLMPLTTRIS